MQNRAKEYSRQKHRLAITRLFLAPSVLVLFIAVGLPTYLKNISLLISSNIYINLIFFSAIFGIINYAAILPLTYYGGFVLEHKFSLSNQTLKDWLKHEAKKGVIGFIISLPFIFSIYTFIKYWPLKWWLFTALFWFFLSIIVARLAPSLIVPLFYKYSPIKNTKLKDRLIRLSLNAGLRPQGVYEINLSKDTKKANAALIGLGSQKRIVLCDTLIQNFNEDEIESVMGHELGHHKLKHILKTISFGGIITLLTFFVTDILFIKFHDILGYARLYDFESLVLIYAIISTLGILTLPLHNAFSRRLERQSDTFALNITNNKGAFISTMKKLAEQNLADTNPSRFYEIMLYDHPPISRRLSFAEGISQKNR